MRLSTAMKTFTIVAALLASGTSLAMAQAASSVNGDQVLVRLPNGAAAYAGTQTQVIRHHR
jgi:hypothetical protein